MKFCEKLNDYLLLLGCTSKEICALSGISQATFSRYRSGSRIPEPGSDIWENLCLALAEAARRQALDGITVSAVKAAFLTCDDLILIDREALRQNFNALIAAFDINLSKLCRHTNYDVSTIFRIRSGSRRPADPQQFADAIAAFAAREIKTQAEFLTLSKLLACDPDPLSDLSVRYERLRSWLLQTPASSKDGLQTDTKRDIADFLRQLDDFDLNSYIKAIRFHEIKVPSVPFQLPAAKSYTGLTEMMESELDFLKATALSKSTAPVIMYSDMPMSEMAKDPEFPKKWMFGMAMLLKKGLHLHQIHNLDRSFEDMMLGLESWIPMYMTGQISPYYLKNAQNNVFLHLLKVSGTAALSGEAVSGHHSEGRYYLTKSKKEVEYYARRAQALLANAHPLMEIYRSEKEKEWQAFLLSDLAKPGKRRSIYSSLPLYTMTESLLAALAEKAQIPAENREILFANRAAQKAHVLQLLQTETLEIEIADISPEELAMHPPTLDLSSIFWERDVFYDTETYAAHLQQTEAFAAAHPGCTLKKSVSHAFRNLQIHIHEGQWAMISKGSAPAIHFVVRHPKLRSAIENFIPPVFDHPVSE